MQRTIRVKLNTIPEQATALRGTAVQFADAFNEVCRIGWDAGEKNSIRLHHGWRPLSGRSRIGGSWRLALLTGKRVSQNDRLGSRCAEFRPVVQVVPVVQSRVLPLGKAIRRMNLMVWHDGPGPQNKIISLRRK